MPTIRPAVPEDAAIIASQRVQMFKDNGLIPVDTWAALERESESWLAKHLAAGTYAGWLVEEQGRVIGGAGVWFQEWPPH